MIARVRWLPAGHITHGYRRVFVIYGDQTLRHVVNLVPMPYEFVYRIRKMAHEDAVEDPSLWWGLSVIFSLVSNGTLLTAGNPSHADDGYIQLRPQALIEEELIPLEVYQKAMQKSVFVFSH